MPSGATADYEVTTPLPIDTGRVLRNYISKKTLTWLAEYDGSSSPVSEITTYNVSPTSTIITNPDGSTTTETFGDTTYQSLMSGIVSRTVNSNGNRTERTWDFNRPTGASGGANINAYVKTEYATIADSNGTPSLTAIKDVTLDPNGNQTEVREYDWVAYSSIPKDANGFPTAIPGGAVLKRKTVSTINNSASGDSTKAYWTATAPNVRNAVASTEVRDGSNNPASRTELTYDNAATTANVTATKSWDSYKDGVFRAYSNPLTTTNSISTSATYNSYGMPLTTTDAKGVISTITYGYINGHYDLYPTQTVAASNYTAVKRTSTAAYDFYTGVVTSTTDVDNSNATTTTSYDNLGRPLTVTNPLGARTVSQYYDANRFVVVKSDLETIGDGRKVATQFYDQVGRVRLSKTLEDAYTQSATDETSGIKVQTRYMTSGGYNYSLTSNPYRASYPSGETGPGTAMGWTRTKVVNHGRQSQTETFSGSSLPAPWGGNGASTGIVSTDLDANRTLVTDQAMKQRISKTNALGQMTDVWEIKAYDPSTVSVTFPGTSIAYGYQTSYVYDTLNNLTTVIQGSQTRSFTYSSLSRLRTAANPESGTMTYGYDSNGNLTSKLDARSITTSYLYDALNRVTQRSYNDGVTPLVNYTYDQYTNSKGRLTKAASSVSTTEYTAFDILGRVTAHKQTTDGTAYTTGYLYNLGGALIEETYPSGRVVKNTLDVSGDLSQVQSKKNAASGFFTYANSFSYNAAGAVTSMQLGNGKWESTQFNSHLQPTQIALGTVQNGTDKLKLDYTYGTTANNGNVLTQKITVARSGQSDLVFDQTYTYDSLNRLQIAEEKTGTTTNWKQTFTFDLYGNRNFNQSATTFPSFSNPNVTNPTVNAANNRFNSGQGYGYDLAGNITADAEGRTFVYDAENKQTSASAGGTIGQYWFDGDGKRVKKYVPASGETTIFVYDASGKLIAEYSTNIVPAENAKVQYLTNDNLGTPRINTDKDGNVASRTDYMPYGEEIIALGGRSSTDKYVADDVRQGFTGYINDGETGLDFAQARMYANKHGRFTSADQPFADQYESDPQSWNLYA